METQHLAGIEMGMCGLPLVTTQTGVYFERPAGEWGATSTPENFHETIELVSELDRSECARYWRDHGFGLGACIEAWRAAVDAVVGVTQ
jgi:hypothetical protein